MKFTKVLLSAAVALGWAMPTHAQKITVGVHQSVNVVVNLPGSSGGKQNIEGVMDPASGMVYIKAMGLPKAGTTGGKRMFTAREAALLYAMRDLALMAVGMHVGGQLAAEDGELTKSVVAGAFSAKVKKGKIYESPKNQKMIALELEEDLGWQENPGVYRLVMEVKLYGEGSLSEAWASSEMQNMLAEMAKPKPQSAAAPAHTEVFVQAAATAQVQYQNVDPTKDVPAPAAGSKTGVIVLCQGKKIKVGLAPKIYGENPDAVAIFGDSVPSSVALEKGAVGYAASETEARGLKDRVGDNPLVITAKAKKGSCGAVVSDDDAKMLADENAKGHFLERCQVVFVVDSD